MRLVLFLTFVGAAFCGSNTYGDEPWYSNGIVYQLYPRSFLDSNGSGVGDLNGVLQKVDYLGELGIDAIWMNPIYPSPDLDFGYDISDFKDIHPIYGTLDVFKKLAAALKARGIKIIMDFVPNHSSNKHPWFSKSENQEPGYKDYYVWHDGIIGEDGKRYPPNNWTAMFGGSMWNYSETRKQFYLHQFLPEQPDLNYRNPRVLEEMLDVLKFWMDIGVGGFRMDAIASLVESITFQDEPFIGPDPNNYGEYNHTMTLEQPETFQVLETFMEALTNHSRNKNLVPQLVMSENYNKDYQKIKMYYGTKDKPRSTFPMNMFWIMYMTAGSNASQWADTINDWNLRAMPSGGWPIANWVLGNHDQHRLTSRFTPEHTDILNMIQLSLKGVAVVYYGDEIGLMDSMVRRDQTVDPQGLRASDDDFSWRTRDPGRGPMPWTNGTNGNFSTGKPWLPLSPNYWTNNVESQKLDSRSRLSIFKTMAHLKKNRTMIYGDSEVTYDGQSLIIYRSLADNPTIVTLANVGYLQDTVNLRKSRATLPEKLRIIVASRNYKPEITSAAQFRNLTVLSSQIVLPPLSGIVVSTELND